MATFNTMPDAIRGNSTDLYISRQGSAAKRQTREQLAASLSNARWIATENYSVGSETTGSDNKKYIAKQSNGPSYVVVDPVSDTNGVYWSLALDLTEYAKKVEVEQEYAKKVEVEQEYAKKVEVEDLSNYIVPVGFTMYSTLSTEPTGRWIKGNGFELSRTAYADLFAAAEASSNYVSQALKDADPEDYAGYYGDGDGSTTFTLPDLRAEVIRGFDDGRGVDAGRDIGSFQGDAIRNIQGNMLDVYFGTNGSSSGAVSIGDVGPINNIYNVSGTSRAKSIDFSASNVVPTADENRMRNIAYTAWIRY